MNRDYADHIPSLRHGQLVTYEGRVWKVTRIESVWEEEPSPMPGRIPRTMTLTVEATETDSSEA